MCVHPGQGEMARLMGIAEKGLSAGPQASRTGDPKGPQREVLGTQTSQHSVVLRENQPDSTPRGARHKAARTQLSAWKSSTEPAHCREATGLPSVGQGAHEGDPRKGYPQERNNPASSLGKLCPNFNESCLRDRLFWVAAGVTPNTPLPLVSGGGR